MLLTQRCDRAELQLPSPHQLRRKIILKHKKLPEYEDGCPGGPGIVGGGSGILSTSGSRSSISGANGDENENMRNFLKEGMLYFKDPVDKAWNLYHFVLTQQQLIYSSHTDENNAGGADDDDNAVSQNSSSMLMPKSKDNFANEELHFGENWFHGKLEGDMTK